MRREEIPSPIESSLRGRRRLAALALTVGLTFLGLAAIAVICAGTASPIPHGPAFDAQFTVLDGFFYADQPAKTLAYQLSCLATPFLLALSYWAARRWTDTAAERAANRLIGIAAVLYLALMILCALPIVYCPNPPFWIVPPSWLILPFAYSHPFYSPARLLLLAAAVGFEFYLLTSAPSRRHLNCAFVALVAVWAVLIPSCFYLPGEINDEPRYVYSLNSLLDALSQTVNGHHLLVNFPHIYGGYGEVLAPIIRLFPREMGTLVAALALPQIIGMFCLLIVARLIIRNPAILFLCGMTLLAVDYVGTGGEIYYGYLTARFAFPPIGLLAATLYFRKPGLGLYSVTSAITALSSIWNLDTGLVLWGSWLTTLLAVSLAARNVRSILRHLLIQTLCFASSWIIFFLYLRWTSGQWPDGGLLFYFQRLVMGSGYFCLRLLFPDMWVFILSLYLITLAVAMSVFVGGKVHWKIPVMLMLSLLGIGIFSYYMGRSVASNLVSVSYPAVLLAGMLCAGADIQVRRKRVPAEIRFFVLPARIALVWWTFLAVAALPDSLKISAHVAKHWNDAKPTPLQTNAAFLEQQIKPHEDGVYFLSNHSGFYYYLSDTLRPIKVPGIIELLRASDMNTVIDAIRNRQIKKLIVDQKFPDPQMYRPEIYDQLREAITQNYQATATGPNGQLVIYTPRIP